MNDLSLEAAVLEQWTDSDAYRAISTGAYQPDEYYELSVTWPDSGKKMTYTADSEEQYQNLVQIARHAFRQKASGLLRVHQRQRRELTWTKTQESVKPLIDRAKSDPQVKALLNKYNQDVSFLDEVNVMISPYLKPGSGRFDPPNTIRIGYHTKGNVHVEEQAMYDAFVHYLSIAAQNASGETQEQPKVWKVLQRPTQQKAIADTIEAFKGQGKDEDWIVNWLLTQYSKVGLTEDAARDLVKKSSKIIEEFKIAQDINDGVLWRQGKISTKAIEQFRTNACSEIQDTVSELLTCGQLDEAIDWIKPYMAYRVQAAGENGKANTVAIDFDGVLAKHDPENETLTQQPIDGAIESLNKLVQDGYKVTIFSCRANKPEGLAEIKAWLEKYGGPDVIVTGKKPKADIYIDDKAVKFTNWQDAMKAVEKQPKSSSLICDNDGSVMDWVLEKRAYQCPACDIEKTIADVAGIVIYAFGPGDSVHVKSVEGTTIGNAHILYKASVQEEKALKSSNLWLVRFADGSYLPVAEQFLVKTGFDDEKRIEAENIMSGVVEPIDSEEDTTLKYDLDKVVEEALQEVDEGKLPTDTILVAVGSKYSLSADDLDFVAEQILPDMKIEVESTEETIFTGKDLVSATVDALEESDAVFEDAKLTPTTEEELDVVLGFLTSEFALDVNDKVEQRTKELIQQARNTVGDLRPPRWIKDPKDIELWAKAVQRVGENAGYGAAIQVFREYKKRQEAIPSVSNLKEASSVTRMAQTDEQEEALRNVEEWAKEYGKKVRPGTTIGKSPQTVILDFTHQGSEIYVDPDGIVKVRGTEVDDAYGFATAMGWDPAAVVYDKEDLETEGMSAEEEKKMREERERKFQEKMKLIKPRAELTTPDQANIINMFSNAMEDGQDVSGALAYVIDGIPETINAAEALEFLAHRWPEVKEELKDPFYKQFFKKKEGEVTEYEPVALPSLTSIPESEYDVVRQQTTAVREGPFMEGINSLKATMRELIESGPDKAYHEEGRSERDNAAEQLFEHAADLRWDLEGRKEDEEFLKNDPEFLELDKKLKDKYGFSYFGDDWIKGSSIGHRQRKKALLEKSLAGIKLDEQQKVIVASILDDINKYDDRFLSTAGQFFTYEWDPGASWEVKEVQGKKQIVRRQVQKKEMKTSKHAFQVGQKLKLASTVFPVDVTVKELLGEDRYRVADYIGVVSEVEENDLFLPDHQNIFN